MSIMTTMAMLAMLPTMIIDVFGAYDRACDNDECYEYVDDDGVDADVDDYVVYDAAVDDAGGDAHVDGGVDDDGERG